MCWMKDVYGSEWKSGESERAGEGKKGRACRRVGGEQGREAVEGEYIITKEEQIGYKSPVSSLHIINDDEQETPTEHNHKISPHPQITGPRVFTLCNCY